MTTQLTASVRDYSGRTVDYLAFDDAKASGNTLLTQTLVQEGQSGALITGIEKLVQRFLVELLTEKGSLEYQPGRGTFFMTSLRHGIVRTSADLFAEFSAAALDAKENLLLEEDFTSDPKDERYAGAVLLEASLLGDTATLRIQVNSVAGETRTVIYPLRIAAI
jgi:hypothetical protein